MHTEVEWGVRFDRPHRALTIVACNNKDDAREMAEAYNAIEVFCYVVSRTVGYGDWNEQP